MTKVKLYTLIFAILLLNFAAISVKAKTSDIPVPILLYHHIAESGGDFNEYIITPAAFREHMSVFKAVGYECITFNDYYDYLNGIRELPPKPVIITFDDGYYSNYQYAYPILKEFGMKATIFIVTDTVGDSERVTYPHFTWKQAQEMEESGVIDIQSHSHSHFPLSGMDAEIVIRELTLSKYLIETNLNKECRYFAYPNGEFDEDCQRIAENAGYKLQCTVIPGYNTKIMPPQAQRRFMVRSDLTNADLLALLDEFEVIITYNGLANHNGTISGNLNYSIINKIEIMRSAVVALAVYENNNKLVYFTSNNVTIAEYGYTGYISNVNIPIIAENNYTVKLFCLDSLTSMQPLGSAILQEILLCH